MNIKFAFRIAYCIHLDVICVIKSQKNVPNERVTIQAFSYSILCEPQIKNATNAANSGVREAVGVCL